MCLETHFACAPKQVRQNRSMYMFSYFVMAQRSMLTKSIPENWDSVFAPHYEGIPATDSRTAVGAVSTSVCVWCCCLLFVYALSLPGSYFAIALRYQDSIAS